MILSVCLGQDNAEAVVNVTTTYDQFMELLCSDVKNDVKKVYIERLCRDMNSLLSYDILKLASRTSTNIN